MSSDTAPRVIHLDVDEAHHRLEVGDLATRRVVSCRSTATLRDVARTMHDHGIGAIVVIDDGMLAGILSERDILRTVAEGVDAQHETVAQHMTADVITAGTGWAVHEAAATMTEHHIRHLVVTDDADQVVGVLSIRDVLLAGQRLELGEGQWAVLRDPMTFTIRERRRLQRQLLGLGSGPTSTLDLDGVIAEMVGSWSLPAEPTPATVGALEEGAYQQLRQAVEQELPAIQLSVHPAPGWRSWVD